ncbi:MAG: prolipoprotein diacylglyceryl transferase [Clostridia bacterium]|nr:prolipoprotein diacylglyceryl transferase [Clostridia bacterium]
MIEFPKLGLEFGIDRVAFHIFGLPIYWYAIIISFGFALAVFLATRHSKRYGIEPDDIIDLALAGAILGFICARAYYVIFNWSAYKDDPIKVFNIREGGIALYGALIGALIAGYFVAKRKKILPFKLFDFTIPYFVLAQAIGRWGNFVNQEAFGTNTTLPWGMTGDVIQRELQNMPGLDANIPVHPAFLYESLWNLGVFFFLIWFRKRKKFEGEVFAFYMILYGIGRAFIESLRTDSLKIGNTDIRVSLVLGLLFALCFTVFIILKRKNAALSLAEGGTAATGFEGVLDKVREEEPKAEEADMSLEEEDSLERKDDEVNPGP